MLVISIDKDIDKGSDLNSGTRESLNLAKAILEPSLATKIVMGKRSNMTRKDEEVATILGVRFLGSRTSYSLI